MTKARPRPVTSEENDSVNGFAKLSDMGFDNMMKAVADLRARDRAYLDSLPADPREALSEIIRLTNGDHSGYPPGFIHAFHFANVIESALRDPVLTDASQYESIRWLSEKLVEELRATRQAIDVVRDVARRPSHIAVQEAAE